MSKSEPNTELRDKIERLVGTAILKNDKNYTDDFMAVIDSHVAQKVAEAIEAKLSSYYGKMPAFHKLTDAQREQLIGKLVEHDLRTLKADKGK